VHSPGIYVQRIIKGAKFEKPIEQRTVRPRDPGRVPDPQREGLQAAEPPSADADRKRSA